MDALFKSCTIRFKLWVTTLGVVSTFIALGGFGSYISKTIEHYDENVHAIGKIEAGILTLRRYEKDFLARLDPEYIDKFDATLSDVVAEMDFVKEELSHVEETEFVKRVDTLEALVHDYVNNFHKLASAKKEVGLNPEDGLYGELRTTIHNVEDTVKSVNDYRVLSDMLMLRRHEKDFMLRHDEKYVDNFNKHVDAMVSNIVDSNISSVQQNTEVANKVKSYQSSFLKLVELERRIGLNEESGLRGEIRASIHKAESETVALIEDVERDAGEHVQVLANILTSIYVAVVLIIIALSYLLVRHIDGSISSLERVIRKVGTTRDLNLRADESGEDEMSHMARAFNTMLAEFQGLMRQVLNSSSQLSTASEELSAITDSTLRGVYKQQSESEQVATAMNEMTSTVQEVARHANDAADASQNADLSSRRGKDVVNNSVEGINQLANEVRNTASSIEDLDAESKNIGTVLSVISGIAEQTNLLALNAAIEAARAGEQGRGFAVVADEVRTLAQRSHESTEEIKGIIDRLQRKAQDAVSAMKKGEEQTGKSVELAKEAGGALDSITQAVATINDMNLQIASAADQQYSVAEEINRNISNITRVSGETSQAAQQTTETSHNLASLAVELQQMISRFKI